MSRLTGILGVAMTAAALGGCAYLDRLTAPDEPAAIATGAEPTESQQQRLAEADAARNAGSFDAALGLFEDILAENPTIVPAYLGIGEIHMVRRKYELAEPAYHRAARLEPRNFDAQFGHGLSLHRLRRFTEAVRAYHRALTIRPGDVDANVAIATTYLQIDQVRSAQVFAEKAVELAPDNGAARSNLGAIYEMLGRNAEAIEQYTAAMELMTASPPLIMNLINVLAKERRYHEVINASENLLKIEASANAYERMGYAYFRLAEYDRSLEAYRAAVGVDPRHWQSFNGIGVNALNKWLLSKKRDAPSADEARDAFRRSLQLNPDQPRVISLMSDYRL